MSEQTKTKGEVVCGWGYEGARDATINGPSSFLKVSNRGKTRMVLLQEKPFQYLAYYYNRRYWPCTGQEHCTGHALGLGHKLRFVYSMYDLDIKRAGVLELDASTAQEIAIAVNEYGFSTGLAVELWKKDGKVSGHIFAKSLHGVWKLAEVLGPEHTVPDPEAILRKQWSFRESER